jgi:hypothetical protein
MLSAVVFLSGDEIAEMRGDPAMALTRSLGGLVTAAVAGVIRDVTIAGPLGLDLATIADHAGCGLVEAPREADRLDLAFALAKGPDVLVLRAAYVPGTGFIEALRDFENRDGQCGFIRALPETWLQRLCPGLAPVAAAIAPLALWRAQPRQDFRRMVRGLKGPTLRTAMHRVG